MRMQWLRLIGFCLLAASLVMVLRQLHPQTAGLLSVAFGVLVMGLVLPGISGVVETIRAFLLSLGLNAQYYRIMLKAMGIVLVTQLCAQVCRDMDAPSVAQRAELCGRLALLGVALPVFLSLARMAVGVLQ